MPKKSSSNNDGTIRALLAGPHRATVEALIASGMALDRVVESCRSMLPSADAAPKAATAAPKTEKKPFVWRSIPTGGFGILAPRGTPPGTYPVFVAARGEVVPTAIGEPTGWTDGVYVLYHKAGAK